MLCVFNDCSRSPSSFWFIFSDAVLLTLLRFFSLSSWIQSKNYFHVQIKRQQKLFSIEQVHFSPRYRGRNLALFFTRAYTYIRLVFVCWGDEGSHSTSANLMATTTITAQQPTLEHYYENIIAQQLCWCELDTQTVRHREREKERDLIKTQHMLTPA